MWININELRINFEKVIDYIKEDDEFIRLYYQSFTGEYNDEQNFQLIIFDTKVERNAVIKQLDELLNVVSL
tara:strand:- start:908 stop:1120 length:213 start_codon:yes stop_codon:yes gene_type:complete